MTIHILDRPDTMPELADWLERHLVSDTIGEVVAELSSVHDPNASSPPLAELIPLETVLKTGLKTVPEDQIRRLFRHPDRLWELQERILIDGEAYWNQVPRPQHLIESSQRGLERLHQSIQTSTTPVRTKGQPTRMWRLVSLAALVLIGLSIGLAFPIRTSAELRIAKEESHRPAKDRGEYLTRLLTLTKEWFDINPQTPQALAARIAEFRRGCSLIQLHADIIPAEDRDWLLPDCRKWSGQLDQQLVKVEDLVASPKSGSFEVIRADTDAIIQRMINKVEAKSKA